MLDCLNKLVGFMPAACACAGSIPETEPFANATSSDIGKFLTDLMPDDFAVQCGDATIFDTMLRTRESAKTDIILDLQKLMNQTGKVMSPWTGFVGLDDGTEEVSPRDFNGMRITVRAQRRGVYATIRKVYLYSADSGTFNLALFKNGNGVKTVPVTITADDSWQLVELSETIQIPMWDDSGITPEYFLVWNANEHVSNSTGCESCNGVPVWKTYFDIDGMSTDNMSAPASYQYNNSMHGIRPQVTFECSFEDLICAAQGDARIASGIVLQYKWAINTIQFIINSGQITKWTALGGEFLEGLLSVHIPRYNENLSFLKDVMYTGDCYTCQPRVSKASMRI